MDRPNLCIAHSGGVTAILNTTAAATIRRARESQQFGTIYAAEFGLNGLVSGRLFDTTSLTDAHLTQLSQTPSSAFGSCRFKLPDYAADPKPYQQIMQTCADFNIQYLVYQGGNDSQDTTLKLSAAQSHFAHPLAVLGLPKTIDNDLEGTDFCPGYPSAAKYIAASIREAALDTWAMSKNSTQVFILEVMGRHTGWLALASGIAREHVAQAPHSILIPEQSFCEQTWLEYVKHCVATYGHCVVVASEGITDAKGHAIVAQSRTDAFGHQQLGGVGAHLANLVSSKAGLKAHWALPDYLQRSAGHLRSATDVACAEQLGSSAVDALLSGQKGVMLALCRQSGLDAPSWTVSTIDLSRCANLEKTCPDGFIDTTTSMLSVSARDYLRPLICGEHYPAYDRGVIDYFDRHVLQLVQQSEVTEHFV